jgi:hypothetical protein
MTQHACRASRIECPAYGCINAPLLALQPAVVGAVYPLVDLFLCGVLRHAITLLNLSRELLAAARGLGKIILGEASPLLLGLTLSCFQFPSTRFQSMVNSPLMGDATRATLASPARRLKRCHSLRRVGERLRHVVAVRWS